jgi:hypothetical protein
VNNKRFLGFADLDEEIVGTCIYIPVDLPIIVTGAIPAVVGEFD